MDCGPATLQCLLAGFGVRVSYGRLREACQTAVDGTSIDTLEEIAVQLGLDAEQVLIPPDHLLVPGVRSFPAIAVVRQADGLPHFVVAWRRHGGLVQVVDPATGRRWPRCEDLVDRLYRHSMPVPAAAWRRFAGSEDALRAVHFRARAAGASASAAARLVERAAADEGWHGLAALEAAARMTESIVKGGGVARGRRSARLLESLASGAIEAGPEGGDTSFVPTGFWSARPHEPAEPGGEPRLLVRGAVLVRVRRRPPGGAAPEERPKGPLSPEILAALAAPPERPFRDLVRTMREDGLLAPAFVAAALAGASVVVVAQALVLRGLLGLGQKIALPEQRLAAMTLLALFAALALLLDYPIATALRRLGRHLETRVRLALLGAIPRLHDRYFRSRLVSDMADRAHGLHVLRALPDLCGGLLRSGAELVLTAGGIAWIDPGLAPLAALAALAAVAMPLVAQPLLAERDLRVRNHAGALSLHYLDAMIGLVPIRTHGAERTARREHESHLRKWVRASADLLRASVAVEGAMLAAGYAFAAALLYLHVTGRGSGAAGGGVLLLAYWALRLPALGQEVVSLARGYLAQRSASLRATEPLGAAKLDDEGAAGNSEPKAPPEKSPAASPRAVSFRMDGVTVVAGGHVILRGVDLDVPAGSHVAIVGASGAGKSSLVSLLLGWHVAAEGRVTADGAPLEGGTLDALRRRTAWVDPTVRLWNRTLLENLLYGAGRDGLALVAEAVDGADLRDVLRAMPRGLDTRLGEAGGFLSGGEAQRVRLARAMLRADAGLVILDEPFRGLDRDRRRELLLRARERWRGRTLLCVTHDVGETRAFDRVLVLDEGRIVEDGPPERLAAARESVYRRLLDADAALRGGLELEATATWRRLEIRGGRVVDAGAEGYP